VIALATKSYEGKNRNGRNFVTKPKKQTELVKTETKIAGDDDILKDFIELLEAARRTSARAVNAVMTATYWEMGWRLVEIEQKGKQRADYGEALLKRLATDLSAKFKRGFSRQNLQQMRSFYLNWSPDQICQTLSGKLTIPPKSKNLRFDLKDLASAFPLPWSHYVKLLAVKSSEARAFYEAEALRSGWTVRQLDRQINSLFYERTALSRNKAAMLTKGAKPKPEDAVTPEEEIKDPLVLEFLGLNDRFSEHELEPALLDHLQEFLLELGNEFLFWGRQKRMRIDDQWYRVDLVLYQRRLRCLLMLDFKLGKLTHADVGQMHLYGNYAREHWTLPEENPPVGLILCSSKGEAMARYALEGLPNKVMAAEYRLVLPDEKLLVAEIEKTRHLLETQRIIKGRK
jgi:predicted nuclease of restriction endonuclease-like (RecB) superfamily